MTPISERHPNAPPRAHLSASDLGFLNFIVPELELDKSMLLFWKNQETSTADVVASWSVRRANVIDWILTQIDAMLAQSLRRPSPILEIFEARSQIYGAEVVGRASSNVQARIKSDRALCYVTYASRYVLRSNLDYTGSIFSIERDPLAKAIGAMVSNDRLPPGQFKEASEADLKTLIKAAETTMNHLGELAELVMKYNSEIVSTMNCGAMNAMCSVGASGHRYDQEATLIGLGLNKRHRSRVLLDKTLRPLEMRSYLAPSDELSNEQRDDNVALVADMELTHKLKFGIRLVGFLQVNSLIEEPVIVSARKSLDIFYGKSAVERPSRYKLSMFYQSGTEKYEPKHRWLAGHWSHVCEWDFSRKSDQVEWKIPASKTEDSIVEKESSEEDLVSCSRILAIFRGRNAARKMRGAHVVNSVVVFGNSGPLKAPKVVDG